MNKHFEVKNITQQDAAIKDVDLKSRTVTGYFSRFGNIDSDEDMIVPGAFTKTIKERGQDGKNVIIHLADHWMSTDNLLGKPKLFELRDGGYFETTFSNTTKANDILQLYEDGVINQHSFGFKTIKAENKKSYREIQEVMIYEISTVVLGANSETPFTGFKSLTKPQLITNYKTLKGAYDNGTYTDDTFMLLEAQLKQLEQEIVLKSISEATEPERSSTLPGKISSISLQAAMEQLKINLSNV